MSRLPAARIASIALALCAAQLALAPVALAAWEYADDAGASVARVRSSGTVKLELPAGGPQFATLTLRRNAGAQTEVFVSLPVAQFTCRATCEVRVRFDERPPEAFAATTGTDMPAKDLFIADRDRFVDRVLATKKVRIEASLAHGAKRVLKFDVAGLRWGRLPAQPGTPK